MSNITGGVPLPKKISRLLGKATQDSLWRQSVIEKAQRDVNRSMLHLLPATLFSFITPDFYTNLLLWMTCIMGWGFITVLRVHWVMLDE